jgi:hypothetical protein
VTRAHDIERIRPRIPGEVLSRISPELAAALRAGVPKNVFGTYVASPEASWADVYSARPLVEIATCDTLGALCVDARTGEVVEARPNRPGLPRMTPGQPEPSLFVASSLPQFIEALAVAVHLLRDYSNDEDRYGSVADELEEAIRQIDPAAVAEETFWASVISDVSFGYFHAG